MKKKIVPAIIAIALIFIILVIAGGISIIERFSYSKERMNPSEYFGITDDSSVAVVLQDELIDIKAKLIDGTYYMSIDDIYSIIDQRFYVDNNEQLLIYTTADDIVKNPIGTQTYIRYGEEKSADYAISKIDGDKLYIALDYVKMFVNFSYQTYAEPNRMQLRTQWGTRQSVMVKKDSAVRYRGGVKSEILKDVAKGEQLTVLEELDDWTKVKTEDCYIGYIEKKAISSALTEEEIATTDADIAEYTTVHKDYKINMGWHAIYSVSGNDTFDEVVNGTGTMSIISPTWFSIADNNGSIRSFASESYVNKAHGRNMEVWAMVDNFNAADVSTLEIMSYTSKREQLVSNLMSYVAQYNLDGLNLDFEQLPSEAVPHYVEFIRELSVACRKAGIVLSVNNYPPQGGSNYNLKEQGVVCDYVIMMGYDEHWAGCDEAGSVASIGYVEQGISMILDQGVPADKLINAIPFYTRLWKTSGSEVSSEALGMNTASEFIANNSITTTWDDATCQNYGEMQKDGTLYQIWLEDKESIETKLTIMNKYGLAGVAQWQLGMEDKDIWSVIDSFVKNGN